MPRSKERGFSRPSSHSQAAIPIPVRRNQRREDAGTAFLRSPLADNKEATVNHPLRRDLQPLFPEILARHQAAIQQICDRWCPNGGEPVDAEPDDL
jgi:hypothetical protein